MKRITLLLLILFGVAAHAQAPQFTCSNASNYEYHGAGASGLTQILAPLAAGGPSHYYLCSYTVQVTQPATPVYFALGEGTGTACSTNTAYRTAWAIGPASQYPSIGGVFSSDNALRMTANNGVCLYLGGAVTNVSIQIRYILAP